MKEDQAEDFIKSIFYNSLINVALLINDFVAPLYGNLENGAIDKLIK